MSFLIVGLGNPGSEYRETRHNIGFMSVDCFAEENNIPWKEKFKGEYGTSQGNYVLKPMTFMNLSGESVQKASSFFKVDPDSILVIHDELDLPYGTAALKKGGGLAGHNGLKSIAQLLGTKDFLRLRLGIGRPVHGDVSNFVLSKFSNDENPVLDKYVTESAKIINELIKNGFQKTATKYSRKSLI